NFPKCDYASWNKPLAQPCPRCKGLLAQSGKQTVKCSQCDFQATPEEVEKMPALAGSKR
ncbi:MAG: hypothetical protein HY680_04595, partial [Chloroflexi bacterium]|nr:hypothetical protein [Chloroflexota bacterium]